MIRAYSLFHKNAHALFPKKAYALYPRKSIVHKMFIHALSSKNKEAWKNVKIAGSVVLMKKNVLDLNDYNASLLDDVHELLGQGVSFQLISSTQTDKGN